jgi:UDP-N-acetyl-D-glucosamine dehydrogenase
MPDYVMSKVADALNDEGKAIKGSKILILGLAYKANVDDCRESPSFVLMEKLQAKGAEVEYNDPFVPVISPTREHAQFTGKKSVEIEDAYDLILISTDHAEYKIYDFTGYSCPLVDSRNCISRKPQKYYHA